MDTVPVYRSYRFTNKDPIIDDMWDKMQGEGFTFRDLNVGSNVSETTMRAWFFGKTRRPQNASIEAFLRTMGYKREIVKMSRREMEDVFKQLPSAKVHKPLGRKKAANGNGHD